MEAKKQCVLCGKMFDEWGNNPEPLTSEGSCCDNCNMTKVIPARLERVYGINQENGGNE